VPTYERHNKGELKDNAMKSRIYRWGDIYEIGRGLGIANPQGALQKAECNGSAKRIGLGRYQFAFKLPRSWQARLKRRTRKRP
jgi:hypothetical protein